MATAVGDQPGVVERKPAPDTVWAAMRAWRAPGSGAYTSGTRGRYPTARNAGIDCVSVDWASARGEQLLGLRWPHGLKREACSRRVNNKLGRNIHVRYRRIIIITAIAGVGGTGWAALSRALPQRDSSRIVSLLLAFAGGISTGVVCFDMITGALQPEGSAEQVNVLFVWRGSCWATSSSGS